MLRYRTGVDRRTGAVLTGWAHCAQSVDVILSTQLLERVMRLDFGSENVSVIGRALTAHILLELYRKAVVAVHRWEPEYRIERLDVSRLERTGGLSIVTRGLYYPEGRFGNYLSAENAETVLALAEYAA